MLTKNRTFWLNIKGDFTVVPGFLVACKVSGRKVHNQSLGRVGRKAGTNLGYLFRTGNRGHFHEGLQGL